MATHLLALSPNYRTCRRASKSPMVLGTVLIADLQGGIRAILNATARLDKEPWYPLILVSPSALDYTTDALTQHYGIREGVHVGEEGDLRDPAVILAAVRARPAPSPEQLAAYVTRRTDRPDLLDILGESFGRGTADWDSGVSRSTLSRRLASFGPLKARDWSALGRIITHLTDQDGAPPGAELRTIKARVQQYTGKTLSEARGVAGWEWVLETALRNWAYVGTAEDSADSVGARMG